MQGRAHWTWFALGLGLGYLETLDAQEGQQQWAAGDKTGRVSLSEQRTEVQLLIKTIKCHVLVQHRKNLGFLPYPPSQVLWSIVVS